MSWEERRQEQLRAARENQQGTIGRAFVEGKLANIDVQAERIDIHLPDALLFDAGPRRLPTAEDLLAHEAGADIG